jgi:hypothetical protein
VVNTGGAFTFTPEADGYNPTFSTNLPWVQGNPSYKLGATALFEGIQSINSSRADGQFVISAVQTTSGSFRRLGLVNSVDGDAGPPAVRKVRSGQVVARLTL